MKINFEHNAKSNGPRETGLSPRQQDRARGQAVRARGYGAYVDGRDSIHPGNALGSRWNRKEPAGQGKTLAELQAQAGVADVQQTQNQMTVMAHTMSDEDFAKMAEEGYDPSQMDPRDAVTILDKIKAELVKAGRRVAGYTDTLDMDTLAAAVGDMGLAQALRPWIFPCPRRMWRRCCRPWIWPKAWEYRGRQITITWSAAAWRPPSGNSIWRGPVVPLWNRNSRPNILTRKLKDI